MVLKRHANRSPNYNGGFRPEFSVLRCSLIVAAISWLIATNPANENFLVAKKQSRNKRFSLRRTTNYGVFAIQERTIQVVVHAGTREWACPYDDPLIGRIVCQRFLRDYLAHEQPVFWNTQDRVYTTHRLLAWSMVGAALIAACYVWQPNGTAEALLNNHHSNILWMSIRSFWYDIMDYTTRQQPISVLFIKLIDLNLFVYPALQCMHRVVQQRGSPTWLAVVSLWMTGLVLANAMATTFGAPLGFRTLTAAAMGYYVSYYCSTRSGQVPSWMLMLPDHEQNLLEVEFQHITWFVVAATAWYRGWPSAVAWWLVYETMGRAFGQWHVGGY